MSDGKQKALYGRKAEVRKVKCFLGSRTRQGNPVSTKQNAYKLGLLRNDISDRVTSLHLQKTPEYQIKNIEWK